MTNFKKLNLTFLFLLISQLTFAQVRVTLSDQNNIELYSKPITIKQVIDVREDKTNIGWVQVGLANIRTDADFKESFEKEIKNFLVRNTQSNNDASEIIVKINALKISEKTGFTSEKGLVTLSIDFILKKENRYYLVTSSSQSSEVKGGDVTKKHPKNIAQAFQKCFDEFSKINIELTNELLEIQADELNSSKNSKVYNPEIFDRKLVDGSYKDFNEFLKNTPSIKEDIDLNLKPRKKEAWTDTQATNPFYINSGKNLKNLWGFSKENTLYVFHQFEYFPVIIQDNEMYFFGYDFIKTKGTSNSIVLGGLAGYAIYSSSQKSKAKNKKVKYRISGLTGQVNPYEVSDNNSSDAKGSIVLFRNEKKETTNNLTLTIDNDELGNYSTNSYIELLKTANVPIEICVNEATCLKIVPNTKNTKYILFSQSSKNNKVTLKLVEKDFGEFNAKRAKYFQDKRGAEGKK